MLNHVIRRGDYLMGELREPEKVVHLVGEIDLTEVGPEDVLFNGKPAGCAVLIAVPVFLSLLILLVYNLK